VVKFGLVSENNVDMIFLLATKKGSPNFYCRLTGDLGVLDGVL